MGEKEKAILGIDPGKQGGIALTDKNGLIAAYKMP